MIDVVLDLLHKVLHLTDNQLALQQRRIQFWTHTTYLYIRDVPNRFFKFGSVLTILQQKLIE